MNENPIWTKDNMLSDRSLFMPMLISFTNLVLLILFIANLYYISLNGLQTGEIRYAGFLQIYYLVAAGLFLFLLLLAPAITVSSLSTEEEEHIREALLRVKYFGIAAFVHFTVSGNRIYLRRCVELLFMPVFSRIRDILCLFKFVGHCLQRPGKKQCICNDFCLWNQFFAVWIAFLRAFQSAKEQLFHLCDHPFFHSFGLVESALPHHREKNFGQAL